MHLHRQGLSRWFCRDWLQRKTQHTLASRDDTQHTLASQGHTQHTHSTQWLHQEGVTHKDHFSLISSPLFIVKLHRDAGLFTKGALLSEAGKDKGMSKVTFTELRGIHEEILPDVAGWQSRMWVIKQDFVLRHSNFKHSIIWFVSLSSLSLTSLLCNHTITGYPNKVKTHSQKWRDMAITNRKATLCCLVSLATFQVRSGCVWPVFLDNTDRVVLWFQKSYSKTNAKECHGLCLISGFADVLVLAEDVT